MAATHTCQRVPHRLGLCGPPLFLVPLFTLAASVGCEPIRIPKAPTFATEIKDWQFGRDEGALLVTPHYSIHTTIRDEQTLDVLPSFLETAHQFYITILPVAQPNPKRSNLYVFRTRNQWESFTRKFSPRRADTYLRIRSGGFAEPDGTVLYYLRRHYTFAVIAHECLHMYVYRNFPRGSVPPWLNEGLACYCEGHEWRGKRPVFTPGKNRYRINALRRAMASGSLFRTRELLATDAGQVLRFSPKRVSVYYAQAWSTIAFLIHGGKYSESFAKLRRELGTDKMRLTVNGYLASQPTLRGRPVSFGEALFRSYITDDLEGFSAEYGVWLKELAHPQPQPWDIFGQRPSPLNPKHSPAIGSAPRRCPSPASGAHGSLAPAA
jgi:hypothetical protein